MGIGALYSSYGGGGGGHLLSQLSGWEGGLGVGGGGGDGICTYNPRRATTCRKTGALYVLAFLTENTQQTNNKTDIR